ncbi:MAG: DNA helicase RecQ [Bacteroidales bacterium]|nr:DNA helicase RecQ [Bacteroidales bacterium]MDD2812642.1 DNA helicase RecQ [Bacteroidales bacterium]MDD3385475.1 DNA helicase RecQ [Bacteroidales bacterium]MDD3872097.1 DNA helicase RecQ [Bacteroidales bacterium]
MNAPKKELSLYLKKYFGFDTFKDNQEKVIENVLAGGDSFVLMPTGGGKSLCYQLPSLIMPGTAIVISPLIALMKNQVDSMRSFSTVDGIAHFLNSSLTKVQITKVLEDVKSARTKLLYVAPESLNKLDYTEFLRGVTISFYAIDEAHCISEWGHDFRPEYRRIRPIIEQIGRAPIMALTATATPKVQNDIQKNLGIPGAAVFKSSFNRENLYYEIRPKVEPERQIIRYIKENAGKSGIIYCLSRKQVEELASTLVVNGIKALPYHAGLDGTTRARNQDMFLMEEAEVIVATIAFGMGIDKPDVRYVIHYDIPKSLEGYYQETGRAGRDGGEGNCITFYSYKDIQKLEKFMQGKPVAEQEIGRQLLHETSSYAESSVCRRKQLLHYFGEEYEKENCENCDNCLHPKTQFEGQDYVVMALDAVLEVRERFKPEHVAKVLVGQVNSAIRTYNHHKLEIFGQGNERDERFWMAVLRQALIAGLLDKDIDHYGTLKLTDEGKVFLENPTSFMLTEDQSFEESDEPKPPRGGGAGAVDPELFGLLKDLRKMVAKKLNLPPFVIFQDPSLEDMAIYYPIRVEEMANITGVGMGKAQRYGKEFTDLIKRYVDEKEIERPQDMVVRSVVNKSSLKVSIIQSIDRKVPLDVVAESKGLDMSELLKELESIVNSGTKINIDYYICERMDDDHRDDIYSYFREDAETESVDEALAELGEDEFTEEEIRLVRIKFISEMGN